MKRYDQQRNPYPLGAHVTGDEIRFSFVSKNDCCGVVLYDRKNGRRIAKLPFLAEERTGNIYCKRVRNVEPSSVLYQFYEGEKVLLDEYAREILGCASYGRERAPAALKAGFLTEDFDWEGDKCPRLPYAQMICYCLHVRGFTKHASSGVINRGTFAGIAEKIPYLREIGVTTVELQPAYEFLERSAAEERKEGLSPEAYCIEEPGKKDRLNYWGYKKGYYYAPKAAYAASDSPSRELKQLIKELHANSMELVMQFYFPEEVKRNEIADILRYWALEYHVDGFHLQGEDLGADLLASDPLLADTKLWYYRFDTGKCYGRDEVPAYPHLAEYNDSWMYDMRRFLKGDENLLDRVLYHMRYVPEKMGRIHYLTNYYGFTLADLFAYDFKHNLANGEGNRDGNNYNCSWNCGAEGRTRTLRVRRLRERQMKNAMCLLMLSQSTPLLFMGDEFGNSQRGNNNPYCQDNSVTWLDWKDADANRSILDFWKQLTAFRREHPILHFGKEPRLMDYLSCGYPDLSYHGENAWQPRTEGYFRYVGQMYCGKYADEEDFIYIAMNMHWEAHRLALPKLPRGMKWELAISTREGALYEEGQELLRDIAPRSISVYRGVRA